MGDIKDLNEPQFLPNRASNALSIKGITPYFEQNQKTQKGLNFAELKQNQAALPKPKLVVNK